MHWRSCGEQTAPRSACETPSYKSTEFSIEFAAGANAHALEGSTGPAFSSRGTSVGESQQAQRDGAEDVVLAAYCSHVSPEGAAEGIVNFSMITCILTGQVTSMRS